MKAKEVYIDPKPSDWSSRPMESQVRYVLPRNCIHYIFGWGLDDTEAEARATEIRSDPSWSHLFEDCQ